MSFICLFFFRRRKKKNNEIQKRINKKFIALLIVIIQYQEKSPWDSFFFFVQNKALQILEKAKKLCLQRRKRSVYTFTKPKPAVSTFSNRKRFSMFNQQRFMNKKNCRHIFSGVELPSIRLLKKKKKEMHGKPSTERFSVSHFYNLWYSKIINHGDDLNDSNGSRVILLFVIFGEEQGGLEKYFRYRWNASKLC